MKQNLLFLRSVLLFLLLAEGAGQVIAENYLPGTWNEWSKTDNNVKFTDGSLTLTLAANTTYDFKIYDTGTEGQSNNWYGNTGTMTVDNHTGWTFTENNNCKITTTVGGSYTFAISWSGSTPTISVTYPEAYTISSGNLTHCTISAFDSYVAPEATVSFTVTPETTSNYSYSVTDVTAEDASGNQVTVTKTIDPSTLVATCSFTMPSSNVNVSAVANDIVVSQSGKTISGNLEGNLIIKNSTAGAQFDITFDNVQTLSSDNKWKSSIIVSNTGVRGATSGQYPQITIYLKGTNAFVNSNAPGFIINPSSISNQRSCTVYFKSNGESIFYIGSNSSQHYALIDELGNSDDDKLSYISIDQTAMKIDRLEYSTTTTQAGSNPNWQPKTLEGTDDAFVKFISACKSTFKFVRFTLNPKSDIRETSAAWITACYPYNCTVTNGEVYEVYGRVMYTENDADVKSGRYAKGDLKHLILKMRDADHKYKVDAGKGYFVRKIDGESLYYTFTIDEGTNVHTDPIKVSGFVGTYESTKRMEVGSYFLYGSQMLHIGTENAAYVDCYRAYFPYTSASDNFEKNVEEYVIKSEKDGYYVYERSSGSGGTPGTDTTPETDEKQESESNGNDGTGGAKIVKLKVTDDGILLFEEELTTPIININHELESETISYYDLMGRRILTPQKGSLYIVNGKKVIY